MSTTIASLPVPPSGEKEIESELLRCVDTPEAILSTRHPFVAYKEINRASGAWRLRIESRHAASAVLYPNAIRLQARAVSEQGKSSFTWSHTAVARSGGTEPLNFRVHVARGEPAAIEVFPRPASDSAPVPNAVKFCWPTV